MIERHSGRMQIVCACGASQPRSYEADEFDVMVSDARDAGWAIRRTAGEWEHSCADCAAPSARQRNLF